MVPIGTQVRVVNQPFLFGWQDNQLYLQPYGELEDDTRDWNKAQKKLLTRELAVTLQRDLKSHNEQINWELVSALTHDSRGIPVAVSTAHASLEQALAAAPRVQNVLPEGSTWDGKSDLPMDEASFKQLTSEMEPGSAPPGSKPGAAPAADAPSAGKAPAASAPATNAPATSAPATSAPALRPKGGGG